MIRQFTRGLLFLIVTAVNFSNAADSAINTLTEAEKKEGWVLLFDGKSFEGWRGYSSGNRFPTNGWSIEDGCIKAAAKNGRPASGGGDILTMDEFSDFDFSFEWRVARGGNSGVKYFVLDRRKSPGTPLYAGDDGRSAVGHEYQLLDDARHPDGRNGPIRQSGSLYSMIPPNAEKKMAPEGEFNRSRIVVRGRHVEHWLNGAKVVEYDLESDLLMQLVAKSKYKNVPRFGTKFKTPILLQDHGDAVWFRNLKVRKVD